MKPTKKPINEGPIVRFVDNFFKSLQAGVAKEFAKEAEKAGIPSDVVKKMEELNKNAEDFKKTIQKLQYYKSLTKK